MFYVVVHVSAGARASLAMMVIALAAQALACTRANPAFRGVSRDGDDAAWGEELPPPALDARRIGDASGLADLPDAEGPAAPIDAAVPADARVPADLASPSPDLASPPDLPPPPPDRAPDRAPDTGLGSALVAYWPFDQASNGTTADVTGNGNTATLRQGATLAPGVGSPRFPGGSSLVLDGTDDHLDLTNRNLPPNEGRKTISVWFRAQNAAAIPIRTIVSLSNDTTDDIGLQLGLDQGRPAAWMYGDIEPMVVYGQTVDANWHHVAITYDGVSKYVLYYDGHMKDSELLPAKTGRVTTPRVGTYQVPFEMFQGHLDDLRIYNRDLGPTEIQALAAGQ
jgi:hypothetical protein